jgi:hypothetical protein
LTAKPEEEEEEEEEEKKAKKRAQTIFQRICSFCFGIGSFF